MYIVIYRVLTFLYLHVQVDLILTYLCYRNTYMYTVSTQIDYWSAKWLVKI